MDQPAIDFETVFILTANRDHAKRDRDCLKEFIPKTVMEFASGMEAMDAWSFHKVDLLLLDAGLTDMEGVKFLRLMRGDVNGALHAYRQALELTPMDENIYFNMAKAFYFLGDKERSLERLRQALSLNPGFLEGRTLYEKLAGSPWPVPADEPVPERPGAQSGALRDD